MKMHQAAQAQYGFDGVDIDRYVMEADDQCDQAPPREGERSRCPFQFIGKKTGKVVSCTRSFQNMSLLFLTFLGRPLICPTHRFLDQVVVSLSSVVGRPRASEALLSPL